MFAIYAPPVPFAPPGARYIGSSSPPQCPPNGELHKASLAPKENAQVTEKPLTCFPLCCLSLFFPTPAQTLPKRGRKKVGGGGTGTRVAPQAGCSCAGPAAPPAQLCAVPQREVGSAGSGPLARPRNYWFLPRLVPFIDSAAERRGYYRSNAVLSLFPPPPSRPLFM